MRRKARAHSFASAKSEKTKEKGKGKAGERHEKGKKGKDGGLLWRFFGARKVQEGKKRRSLFYYRSLNKTRRHPTCAKARVTLEGQKNKRFLAIGQVVAESNTAGTTRDYPVHSNRDRWQGPALRVERTTAFENARERRGRSRISFRLEKALQERWRGMPLKE